MLKDIMRIIILPEWPCDASFSLIQRLKVLRANKLASLVSNRTEFIHKVCLYH